MNTLPRRKGLGAGAAPRLLALWLMVAVTLTVSYHLMTAKRPYVYLQAWQSADVSTMARSFVENGIITLGGVPLNNNKPLGLSRSAYTHWPPLLPIVLSQCFSIFGESEATAHRLALAILFASAFLVHWIARLTLGRLAALMAAFCWLTLPVVVAYGYVPLQQSLGMLFMMATLLAFLKATVPPHVRGNWAVAGGAAMILAVWSSWEPILLAPGLLAAALWNRRPPERRLAIIYGLLALTAMLVLLASYAIQYPSLMIDTWQTVKFRMGISDIYSTQLLTRNSAEPRRSLAGIVFHLSQNHWNGLDLLGLAATAWVVLTGLDAVASPKGSPTVVAFCGLLTPWFLWSTIMSNHTAGHDFEMFIAAPAVALSLAWAGREILRALASCDERRLALRSLVVLLVVPVLMLKPWGEVLANNLDWHGGLRGVKLKESLAEPDETIRFANEIRDASSPDAVILAPIYSMVEVYYSRRHIVRLILNDDLLSEAIPKAAATFPGSPLYLALPPSLSAQFPRALRSYPVLKTTPGLILLEIKENNPNLGSLFP